nr:nickel-type superoxide dismutase maturation protease [Actinomycetota bacterium]
GPSMLPALAPGERLLVLRTRTLRDGELVVVRDPHAPGRVLVKRVASVGAGGLVVVGDNAGASRDSRHFGPVAASDVLGRPWYRYSPEGSRGRLARRPR